MPKDKGKLQCHEMKSCDECLQDKKCKWKQGKEWECSCFDSRFDNMNFPSILFSGDINTQSTIIDYIGNCPSFEVFEVEDNEIQTHSTSQNPSLMLSQEPTLTPTLSPATLSPVIYESISTLNKINIPVIISFTASCIIFLGCGIYRWSICKKQVKQHKKSDNVVSQNISEDNQPIKVNIEPVVKWELPFEPNAPEFESESEIEGQPNPNNNVTDC